MRRPRLAAALCLAVVLLSTGLRPEVPPLLSAHGAKAPLPEFAGASSAVPATLPAGVAVYRVYYGEQEQLDELARDLDVWEVRPAAGYAVLPLDAERAAHLVARGWQLAQDAARTEEWALGPPQAPCYRDVDALYQAVGELVAAYPDQAELIDYGDSWRKQEGRGGYDLLALRISSKARHAPKVRMLLMANIHARELVTPEMALHFARYLLERYGLDADVTWIVDSTEVYVIVTANPDGRQLVEAGCYQRKNLNDTAGNCIVCDLGGWNHFGVDLNRNNPYRWGEGSSSPSPCDQTYRGPGSASESETYYLNALVRNLFADQRPDDDSTPAPDTTEGLLISLHSYGNLVMWPWGWTRAPAPNHAALQTLGRKFSFWNGYEAGQSSILLYTTTGDTTDWAYAELGIAAYTFEVGDQFFQPCASLDEILAGNLAALLYAAKAARSPYTLPSGPDAYRLAVVPDRVAPGTPIQLTATIDDTRYSGVAGNEPVQPIVAAEYYVDVPPWSTMPLPAPYAMAPLDGVFDDVVEQVQAVVDTSALQPGAHLVLVHGLDASGQWGAVSALFFHVVPGGSEYRAYLPILTRDEQSVGRVPLPR
jgi:carboxypeptidase T